MQSSAKAQILLLHGSSSYPLAPDLVQPSVPLISVLSAEVKFIARFAALAGLCPRGTAWRLSASAEALLELDMPLSNTAKLLPGVRKPRRQMDTRMSTWHGSSFICESG